MQILNFMTTEKTKNPTFMSWFGTDQVPIGVWTDFTKIVWVEDGPLGV